MCAAELPFYLFVSKLRLRCRAKHNLDLEHGLFFAVGLV